MSAVSDPAPPDFADLLPLIERVIAFVVRKHHASAEEAEDFRSHVILKLFENDAAVLHKFQARSSLRTYLSIVVSRLFLDYRTAAWGKWRNSEEARRRGEIAMLLERLTGRDGLTLDEAHEMLRTNYGVTLSRDEVETLAASFPVRAKRRFEEEEALHDLAAPGRSADDLLDDSRREASVARCSKVLARAVAGLEPQDRLILVLHYRDGRKVSEIAQLLRLEQRPLYRRLERILKRLRQVLEDGGCDGSVLVPVT